MIDPHITSQLEESNGVWRAKNIHRTSYPSEAHDLLFDVEDDSFWFRHRNRCILNAMQRFPPHGFILDIGGGNGYVTKGLLNEGYHAILLESGFSGVANARSRGIPDIIHATFEDARIESACLENAGLFDVLEHVEDDVAFLTGIHAALKPNGRLYLTVPAHPYLWSWTDRRAGHFRRYTRQSLKKAIERSGLSMCYLSYFFFGLSIPIFLTRTLPTRLKRHPDQSHAHRKRTHQRPTGRLGSVIDRLWQMELRWLRRGRLSFGSSLIAIAQK